MLVKCRELFFVKKEYLSVYDECDCYSASALPSLIFTTSLSQPPSHPCHLSVSTCLHISYLWTWSMDMKHGHEAWTWSMDVKHGHEAWTCSYDMRHRHGHAVWTCTMDISSAWKCRVDAAWTCSNDMPLRTCSMDTQHGHVAWTCRTHMHHGHAAWTSSMEKQQGYSAETCSRDIHLTQDPCELYVST